MQEPIQVNLNDFARVKLTEHGEQIIQERKKEIDKLIVSNGGTPSDYDPLGLDKDGYYRDQLWSLIETFGGHIGLGLETPFKGNDMVIEKYRKVEIDEKK